MIDMGNVYIEKDYERRIILLGEDINKFVNEAVNKRLSEKEAEKRT